MGVEFPAFAATRNQVRVTAPGGALELADRLEALAGASPPSRRPSLAPSIPITRFGVLVTVATFHHLGMVLVAPLDVLREDSSGATVCAR